MNPTRIEPLGDCAFLAHFADQAAASGWAAGLRAKQWPEVTDIVLAYRTVAIFANPERAHLIELENRLGAQDFAEDSRLSGQCVTIPVLYAGEDLSSVAAQLHLSSSQVIELHCSVVYDVFAIGFQPGFPYAGYLPPALSGLARRASPRLRVPAGSVAIAGRQTAVYPTESPGGWHLLGTTPLCIIDLESGYFPIRAGDRIRFEPIDAREFEARRHERL